MRALNILSKASLIACEDTRNTGKLLKFFNISNKLILLSCSSVLLQVLVVVYYTQNNEIGSFSLFYNIVNLFILTFLYIYRNEMKVNYHLYWSFALLFLMGMEIRAIQTIGLGLN